MSEWQLTVMIVGMTCVTIFSRLAPALFVTRFQPTPKVQKWLRQVSPAVMAAIVLPALLAPERSLDLSFSNAAPYIGIATGVVAYFSRSFSITIIFGIVATSVVRLAVG